MSLKREYCSVQRQREPDRETYVYIPEDPMQLRACTSIGRDRCFGQGKRRRKRSLVGKKRGWVNREAS